MARDYPSEFVPTPVDRVAGRVISSGVHYEFQKKDNNREVWDTPPETVPLFLVPSTVRELFGDRKSRLVVVGYLGVRKSGAGKKQRLLVRCDCGKYEVRIAQRWRQLRGLDNYCQFCEQLEKLKTSHLPDEERDRLDDAQRERAGLPAKKDVANQRRKNWSEQQLNALLTRK